METCDLFLDELKFAGTQEGEFSGVAVTFGTEIETSPHSHDTILYGAFAKSLATKGAQGVKMLWQHNVASPIGLWTVIQEQPAGLFVRGKLLLEIEQARTAYALLKHHVVTGLSIGYAIPAGGSRVDGQKRTISEINLMEISPVTFPADRAAQIREVRAQHDTMTQVLEEIRRVRRLLRGWR